MNVHVSYKVPKSSDLEQQITQAIEKLNKRLQVFRPDLVHLHAVVEERQGRSGLNVKLDLKLPSGDLSSRAEADRADPAIKGAFEDLLERVGKHKARLRAKHHWPRTRRTDQERNVPQVPFEQTVAAVMPDSVSDADISSYVNANLVRLQRFVERELRYRENSGELRSNQVNPQEVIGEAIANALGQEDKPEKLSLEPWLYRLSLMAIHELSHRDGDGAETVNLDRPARNKEMSEGSDESMMQFHQPDESLMPESLIPDRGVLTPEDTAASDEMVEMVELALRGAGAQDREAFLLFGIEGFTVEEISAISSRPVDAVRSSIKTAREHLRKNLPVPDEFKDKLLQHTKTA